MIDCANLGTSESIFELVNTKWKGVVFGRGPVVRVYLPPSTTDDGNRVANVRPIRRSFLEEQIIATSISWGAVLPLPAAEPKTQICRAESQIECRCNVSRSP